MRIVEPILGTQTRTQAPTPVLSLETFIVRGLIKHLRTYINMTFAFYF